MNRRSLCGSVDWNIFQNYKTHDQYVAPFVGVWIEIKKHSFWPLFDKGRSLCGSVDWNTLHTLQDISCLDVAPFVGVWIEMSIVFWWNHWLQKSLPLWECGLKYQFQTLLCAWMKSLPLWECGLKSLQFFVRSKQPMSLPLWECGLKFMIQGLGVSQQGRSLCGSVDWNTLYSYPHTKTVRRSLCGSVDWNSQRLKNCKMQWVAPFVGVWIEM